MAFKHSLGWPGVICWLQTWNRGGAKKHSKKKRETLVGLPGMLSVSNLKFNLSLKFKQFMHTVTITIHHKDS